MHIQLNHLQGKEPIKTREFSKIEGNAGYAVRLGSKLVGFSEDEVASVSLEVNEGRLRIQLHSEEGGALGEYQIPSTELLRQGTTSLADTGIYFSPREADELANLLRLTMSGSVSPREIMLILDEISHIAPMVEGAGGIDAGDIYPTLSNQVKQLLGVMPEEIQRFVLLSNKDGFGDDLWQLFQFLSKVDSERHPATTRFLAGQGGFTYVVKAEMEEIAAQNPLIKANPIKQLDPQALQKLLGELNHLKVTGDPLGFRFPQTLSRFIFDHFPMRIPDFTAAESFEALEADLMKRLAAGQQRRTAEAPLRQLLRQGLDHKAYQELADYLMGKPGARFELGAREELLHFLKNLPGQKASEPIVGIRDEAFARITKFLQAEGIDPDAFAPLPEKPMRERGWQETLHRHFKGLEHGQKLGLFVLDHLDPLANHSLFRFFSGQQRGLRHLSPTMIREVETLVQQPKLQAVPHSGIRFSEAQFESLARLLQNRTDLALPESWLPGQAALRKAVFMLSEGGETLAMDGTASVGGEPRPKADFDAMMRALYKELEHLSNDGRNEAISRFLSKQLGRFRQVAILDQTWKGQRLARLIQNGQSDLVQGSRELVKTLRDLSQVLSGSEESKPDWDLWRRAPSTLSEKETPGFQARLLREQEGVARYLRLDRQLPGREGHLADKLQELGQVRRFEVLAEKLQSQITSDHGKLADTVRRAERALTDLARLITDGEEHDWHYHNKSPLSKRKLNQFQQFREALMQGKAADLDALFEGPFLRSEMGDAAERRQSLEMKRLEPLFREAMSRLQAEPGEVLDQLMEVLHKPREMGSSDVAKGVRQLLDNLHDFNQHQNLNNEPIYLSMPLKWGQQESEMELACFKVPGKKDQKRFLVVIHLDFIDWGHLRVDALKEHEVLQATFWVESMRMHDLILKELHALEDRLEEQGLGDVMMNVKLEPKRAAKPVADLCVPPRHEGELDMEI